jgi:hypothetical protein
MARRRILFEELIVTQLVNNLTTVPVLITEVCQRTVSCARKSGPPSSVTLLLLHQGEKLWNSLNSLLHPSVSLRSWVTETCPGDQEVETCAPLGYYATSSGYFLPKFRDNLSAPASWVKNLLDSWPLKMESRNVNKKLSLPWILDPWRWNPETSIINCHYLGFLTPEDGTDMLSPKVCKKLPLFAK